MMKPATAFRISAALAFLGVALGAFGAHALDSRLTSLGTIEIWRTASFYHLVHAVALLVISRELPGQKTSWWSMFLGVLVFSGSLYVLALTDLKKLGMITPLGGLALLVGWALLIFSNTTEKKLSA